jgi:hypothetical protein
MPNPTARTANRRRRTPGQGRRRGPSFPSSAIIKGELGDDSELLMHFYDDTGFQQSDDGSRDTAVRNFIERRAIRMKEILAMLGEET